MRCDCLVFEGEPVRGLFGGERVAGGAVDVVERPELDVVVTVAVKGGAVVVGHRHRDRGGAVVAGDAEPGAVGALVDVPDSDQFVPRVVVEADRGERLHRGDSGCDAFESELDLGGDVGGCAYDD